MARVAEGSVVQIHYTGRLEDGTVFDSSEDREPLEFAAGSEQLIEGVSKAVIGMDVGEMKTVEVPPEQAYGEHDPGLTHALPKSEIPGDVKIGDALLAVRGEKEIQVWVSDISDDEVVLDSNHPLAGRKLIFDLEIISVRPPMGQ